MKLDTLREGNEKKSIMQEPKPFHNYYALILLPDFLRDHMRELNKT